MKLSVLVLLAALLVSNNLAYCQDLSGAGPKRPRTPEDYKPRTLKEIAALSLGETGKTKEVLTGDLLPSRVRVTFQSAQRPISRATRKIISDWANRYAGDPRHYTKPYQTELLFRETRLNYWLVVNKDLLPCFKKASRLRGSSPTVREGVLCKDNALPHGRATAPLEMKKGTAIELNLIRLGGFKTESKWVWVLLVESIRSEVRDQRSEIRSQ